MKIPHGCGELEAHKLVLLQGGTQYKEINVGDVHPKYLDVHVIIVDIHLKEEWWD